LYLACICHGTSDWADVEPFLNAEDGQDIQDVLKSITGQRTVPQVFVAEEFLGGATETLELHQKGDLLKKLDAAGVSHR
jgi:glutaredoxin-related protein